VLPVSTGGVPGCHRARRAETSVTEEGGRQWGGGKGPARWCSGGRAAGWRCPWGGPVASGGGGEGVVEHSDPVLDVSVLTNLE
jgi:hypothetical protein